MIEAKMNSKARWPVGESQRTGLKRRRGASLTGYGLIVGLIAIAAILAVGNVGDEISALFGAVSEQMEGIISGAEGGGSSTSDLAILNPIPNQVATTESGWSFTVPLGTFSDDSATLSAASAGGGALPAFISFNPVSGNFTAPASTILTGIYNIEVTASLNEQSITDDFSLTVTEGVQSALFASDAASGAMFGNAFDVVGDSLVIGAANHAPSSAGEGYLFTLSTGTETAVRYISDDRASSNFLCASMAASGTRVICGAFGRSEPGQSNQGAAYIFTLAAGAQELKLLASDGDVSDQFGYSVDLDGTTAIAGAPSITQSGANLAGAAYLFDVTDIGPVANETIRLLPDPIANGDQFGASVRLDSGIAAVGAPRADLDGSTANTGAVFLFDISSGDQLFRITAEDAATGAEFGSTVEIRGNRLLVVAPKATTGAGIDAGKGYLFDVTSGAQLMTFEPDDAATGDQLGLGGAISLQGSRAGIGARQKNGGVGAAYIFDTISGNQITKLTASDGQANDLFGGSILLTPSRILVGARAADKDPSPVNAGAVYIFE